MRRNPARGVGSTRPVGRLATRRPQPLGHAAPSSCPSCAGSCTSTGAFRPKAAPLHGCVDLRTSMQSVCGMAVRALQRAGPATFGRPRSGQPTRPTRLSKPYAFVRFRQRVANPPLALAAVTSTPPVSPHLTFRAPHPRHHFVRLQHQQLAVARMHHQRHVTACARDQFRRGRRDGWCCRYAASHQPARRAGGRSRAANPLSEFGATFHVTTSGFLWGARSRSPSARTLAASVMLARCWPGVGFAFTAASCTQLGCPPRVSARRPGCVDMAPRQGAAENHEPRSRVHFITETCIRTASWAHVEHWRPGRTARRHRCHCVRRGPTDAGASFCGRPRATTHGPGASDPAQAS